MIVQPPTKEFQKFAKKITTNGRLEVSHLFSGSFLASAGIACSTVRNVTEAGFLGGIMFLMGVGILIRWFYLLHIGSRIS